MTQRNPRLQGPPVLVWAGLALLLLGLLQGKPTTFVGEASQTLCMVAGQLLLLGTMLLEGWRAGRGKPPVLMLLGLVVLAGAGLQLWGLWEAWQVELIERQVGS
ncbi:hypothetical protein [Deinococcus hohokamensis]|uniref:Uncharacterized protein n=1 Tax=Deinococcus hohokamensis TaxID=309883 RepID=A0ABV9I962_9DEIO